MKILSLFDGMSCGAVALIQSGINIDCYDAFETDRFAVQTSLHNFPFITHHGDVFDADFRSLSDYRGGEYDFVIGGSPCTYWSIAKGKTREITAQGSGWQLFCQYVRAIQEVKPKFFIYENNKSMSADIRQSISQAFGFEPVCINSALVSAQNRERLYWVGKLNSDGTYSRAEIPQPHDSHILLRDVIDTDIAKPLSSRELEYMASGTNGRYSSRWTYLIKPGEKDKSCCITANIYKGVPYNICAIPVECDTPDAIYVYDNTINIKGVPSQVNLKQGFYLFKKLTVQECMRLQTIPQWYSFPVSDSRAYKMIGNGWTVEVISHIFKSLLSQEIYT